MPTPSVGEIVKNGVLFDLKNWSKVMPSADNLTRGVDRLFRLLAERQGLLAGGWHCAVELRGWA